MFFCAYRWVLLHSQLITHPLSPCFQFHAFADNKEIWPAAASNAALAAWRYETPPIADTMNERITRQFTCIKSGYGTYASVRSSLSECL